MNFRSLIKIAVSAVMLALVLHLTNFERLGQVIGQIPIIAALTVVAGYVLGQLLSSYKWYLIARSAGVATSYLNALRAYFIGMFVNCFGLGIVGGDIARGLLIAKGDRHKLEAISSVAVDRVHGLAVLTMIGMIATFTLGAQAIDASLVPALITLATGLLIAWFIVPPLLPKFLPAQHRLRKKLTDILGVFPRDPFTLIQITTISACFHCLQIALHRVIGHALGLELSWSVLFVVIPFVSIASSLPISWNGLGVRENAYRKLLTPTYLSVEQAVAFGVMWLFAVTASSAIGGIVAFLTDDFAQLKREVSANAEVSELNTPGLERST